MRAGWWKQYASVQIFFICYDFFLGGTAQSYILTIFYIWKVEGLGFVEHCFPFCEHRQPSRLDDLLGTEEADLQVNSLATARNTKRATKGDRKNQFLFSSKSKYQKK